MDGLLPGLNEIENAAQLIYQTMPATPQYSWPLINARAGAEVWVKHENHTQVGAFKVRGGLVYMDWLRRERPDVKTVVSATRGNHGQSMAFAAAQYGIRVVLVVPFWQQRREEPGDAGTRRGAGGVWRGFSGGERTCRAA